MTEFYSSYIVGDAPLDLVANAQLAQPTGETVTRTNQRKTYKDEDGNQVFDGYEYFEEDVQELKGGWVLEADGMVEGEEKVGKVLISTAEVLDAIASNPDVVEVSRFDKNGNPVVPDEAEVATRTGKDKPTKEERKAEKNQKLKSKGFKELPEDIDADSSEAVEAVFKQMNPNYKYSNKGA